MSRPPRIALTAGCPVGVGPELLAQGEVRRGILGRRPLAEVHEEIQVARRGAACRRAEQLQPAHAQPRADRGELGAVRLDFGLERGVQIRMYDPGLYPCPALFGIEFEQLIHVPGKIDDQRVVDGLAGDFDR